MGFDFSLGSGSPSFGGGFTSGGGFSLPSNNGGFFNWNVQSSLTNGSQPSVGSDADNSTVGTIINAGTDVLKSFLTWDVMKAQVAKNQYPSVSYTGTGQPGAILGSVASATGLSTGWILIILAVVIVLILRK